MRENLVPEIPPLETTRIPPGTDLAVLMMDGFLNLLETGGAYPERATRPKMTKALHRQA